MSALPGAARMAVWAVRRPRYAIRLLRTQTLWVVMTASDALPGRLRRLIYRPIEAFAATLLRRPGDHTLAAPLQVLALHELGDDDKALALAEVAGRRGSPRTAVGVARVVMTAGEPALAKRLLDAHPELPDDHVTNGLRAQVASALGEYGAAIHFAERAIKDRPGSPGLRRIADKARGELALMDPAWRPVIRPAPSRMTTPTQGRILHLLTNSLPHRPAGYTVRAQQVAQCQQAVGLDPHFATRAGFPGNEGIMDTPATETVDGVTYHRIEPELEPGLPVDRIATATARGLAGLVAELRPALLQPATNYANGQVALAVGELTGLPVVYEVRGFLEETWIARMGDAALEGERYLAQRAIETACMRRAAAVVTLSETMRADILDRGGIAPENVVVIANAVDVDRFVPGPRDDDLAATLGIDPDETVIGYVSSFAAYEGIDYLIEAVAELRRRGRRVRLLLVGDGDARPALEATAERVGLLADRTVIFTGRVPHADVERHYRTIDVFVVPRTNDRVSRLVTPLKPYEAMSMAKATVVSGVPALLEIVRDGETGRTFPAEDPIALADVLEGLVDDPAERARLGAAAREWVAANRTWAQNGERYLALYRRLGVA